MKHIRDDYFKHKLVGTYIPACMLFITVACIGIVAKDVTKTNKGAEQSIETISIKDREVNIKNILGETAEYNAEQIKATANIDEYDVLALTIQKEKVQKAKEAKIATVSYSAAAVEQKEEVSTLPSYANKYKVKTGTKTYPEKVLNMKKMINYYSNMFKVDPYVVASIISQESSGNPNCVSATSVGIAQIDSALKQEFINFGAKYFNQTWDLADRYEVAPSIAFLCYRLRTNLDYYEGDYCKAIQAYNFSHYSLDCLIQEYPQDWYLHTSEIAYYNGHYRKTGSTRYGDPNYISNVLGFYNPVGW